VDFLAGALGRNRWIFEGSGSFAVRHVPCTLGLTATMSGRSTGTPRHRTPTRLGSLVLAAGAVLATFLVLELAVRVTMPQDLAFFDGSAIKRRSERPGLRYELIPGGYAPRYVGVPVSVNRLGLRDREVEVPKPPGTVRILGVGDSVTFGYGVRLKETYLKVLEDRLRESAGGRRYEVVNAGIEECGLDAYYHAVRTLAPKLQSDLVLVGIVLNDVQRYDDLEHPVRPHEASIEPGLARRAHGALLARSQLYHASVLTGRSLLYRFHVLDVADLYGSPLRAVRQEGAPIERAWASSLGVLDQLVAAARGQGLRLVLVVFPVEVQLDEAAIARYRRDHGVSVPERALDGEPQRRLLAFGAKHDVPVVDLLPALRAAGGVDLYLRTGPIRFDPVHFSPRGHRIVAEAIHRALVERRLLSGGV
jgi:lysophospholipase L1-like esterase